jgi:hypothetical protein
VPQPVGVHAGNAGRPADAVHDAGDEVPVQRAAVVGDQPLVGSDVVEVGRGPGGEQVHQLGVQGNVAVVAELAQRDAQPVPGADPHHRIGGEVCQFAGAGRAAALREPGLSYSGSVAFGGPWLLDQLWARLGIAAILAARLGKTRRDPAAERVLFALVASRALDPSSKLAAAHWVGRKAWVDRLPETTDDACYRAMDWLHQVKDAVEQEIYGQVANLLNLEVDLLFFDTTSTYFELDEEDEPAPGTAAAT